MPALIRDEKVELPSGRLAVAMVTEIVPEQTIIIPEKILYPDVRRAFEGGTFAPGDKITISVTVTDSDGKDKTPDDSDFQLELDNYTRDPNKEVLGVLYMNFVESNKVPEIAKEVSGDTISEPIEIIKG